METVCSTICCLILEFMWYFLSWLWRKMLCSVVLYHCQVQSANTGWIRYSTPIPSKYPHIIWYSNTSETPEIKLRTYSLQLRLIPYLHLLIWDWRRVADSPGVGRLYLETVCSTICCLILEFMWYFLSWLWRKMLCSVVLYHCQVQ
jgi:hypothetical protein